jgi:ABC-type uncharacterized transport system fused permease/ATPase subunit
MTGPLVQAASNADSTQEARSNRRYSTKEECKANPFALRPGRELEWTNVNVQVARKENANIQVLQDISGKVQPRQLTCIMGHSGAGYVQLFKALSTRFFFVSLTDLVLGSIRFVCLIVQVGWCINSTLLAAKQCVRSRSILMRLVNK